MSISEMPPSGRTCTRPGRDPTGTIDGDDVVVAVGTYRRVDTIATCTGHSVKKGTWTLPTFKASTSDPLWHMAERHVDGLMNGPDGDEVRMNRHRYVKKKMEELKAKGGDYDEEDIHLSQVTPTCSHPVRLGLVFD